MLDVVSSEYRLSWLSAESAPLSPNDALPEQRRLEQRRVPGRCEIGRYAPSQYCWKSLETAHAVEVLARRVVGQRALADRRVLRAQRLGRRRPKRVVEELVPGALERVLAGHEELAALVHEVPRRDDLVVEELLGAGAAAGGGAAGPDLVGSRTRVVARVPDDRLVVAEHAQVRRRGAAVGVHVVDVVADARVGEGVLVVVEVLRSRHGRGVRRRGLVARVVLGAEDQHLRVRSSLRTS